MEADIRVNSPGYAALMQPHSLGTKEIQQLLGANTLLLEYAVGESRSYQGFDFTFDCSSPFNATTGSGFYPGKWRKDKTVLVILTTEIGKTDKHHNCELKIALKNDVYGMKDGHLITYSQAQLKAQEDARQRMQKDLHPSDVDPAHYPLKVFLLSGDWQQGPYGFSGHGKAGYKPWERKLKVAGGDIIVNAELERNTAKNNKAVCPHSRSVGDDPTSLCRPLTGLRSDDQNRIHNSIARSYTIGGRSALRFGP